MAHNMGELAKELGSDGTSLEDLMQEAFKTAIPLLKNIRESPHIVPVKFRQGYLEAAYDALLALEWLQSPKEFREVIIEKKPYHRRDIKLFAPDDK